MRLTGFKTGLDIKLSYKPEEATQQQLYLKQLKTGKEAPKTDFQRYLDQLKEDNYYCYGYGSGCYFFRKGKESLFQKKKKKTSKL